MRAALALAAEGSGDTAKGEARALLGHKCVCHTGVSSDQPHTSKSCSLTMLGQLFGSK